MKILITGASGMVGRNLVAANKSQHSLLTPTSRELNLKDYQNTEKYLQKNLPDFIIHCAGKVGGIQANIKEPVNFLIDNLDMGRNLFTAARKTGIPRAFNLGTSCMYPKNCTGSIAEEFLLTGELEPTNEGYALAKITTARLCEYISQANEDLSYKTLIPCNLYGRWDKFSPEHSHLIPAIIHKVYIAIKNGENEVTIWGDGTTRREFMYAEDFAEFIYFAIDNFDNIPKYLNVGLGNDFSINEYYRAVAGSMNFRGKFVHDLSKPTGMRRKLMNVDKLHALGWRHSYSLEEGIARTVQFYEGNIAND